MLVRNGQLRVQDHGNRGTVKLKPIEDVSGLGAHAQQISSTNAQEKSRFPKVVTHVCLQEGLI